MIRAVDVEMPQMLSACLTSQGFVPVRDASVVVADAEQPAAGGPQRAVEFEHLGGGALVDASQGL